MSEPRNLSEQVCTPRSSAQPRPPLPPPAVGCGRRGERGCRSPPTAASAGRQPEPAPRGAVGGSAWLRRGTRPPQKATLGKGKEGGRRGRGARPIGSAQRSRCALRVLPRTPPPKGPEGSSALPGTTGREIFVPLWEAALGTSGHCPPPAITPLFQPCPLGSTQAGWMGPSAKGWLFQRRFATAPESF